VLRRCQKRLSEPSTDDGTTGGTPLRQRRTFQNWRPIGRLIFDNAVVSYNGDSVVHFNHPTWRSDRNDPSTATRVDGRKIRLSTIVYTRGTPRVDPHV
jgi:hypothetical protein